MRVHHLNAGTMCPRPKRLVNGQGHLVCHVLLVEGRDGLLLVETGLGTDDIAAPRERLGQQFLLLSRPVLSPDETAAAQVRRMGHDPRDVTDIVLTHLDLDHAGGIGDFPTARVHVQASELAAARQRATRSHRDRYRPPHWAHGPTWVEHAPSTDEWMGFVGATEVRDGVLVVPLPGHSPGHQGVAVETEDGWLLHAGDSFFHADEMRRDSPSCSLGLRLFQAIVTEDKPARIETQERLRSLASDPGNGVEVFCAHDPAMFASQL